MSEKSSNTGPIKMVSLNRAKQTKGVVCALPAFLQDVREQAKKFISEQKSTFIQNIDDSLFEMANRATSNDEQNGYLDSVRELRIWQHKLLRDLYLDIDRAFDDLMKAEENLREKEKSPEKNEKSTLSLVNNDDLEEIIALDVAVAKAKRNYCSTLESLSFCFDTLVPSKVSSKNNPVGPDALTKIFQKRASDLDIDIRSKLIMYKVFDKHVLSELGGLYKSIIEIMSDYDIPLPVINYIANRNIKHGSTTTPSSDQSEAEEIAQKFTENMNSGPDGSNRRAGYYNDNSNQNYGRYEPDITPSFLGRNGASQSDFSVNGKGDRPNDLIALLNTLQHQPQNHPKSKAKIHELLSKISQGGNSDPGSPVGLQDSENEVLSVFDNLFKQISEDDSLSPMVLSMLSQLQIPLMKVALLDSGFLSQSKHSARRLLNELISAAATSEVGEKNSVSDPLVKKINQIIHDIVANFDSNLGIFDETLRDFQKFKALEERRASLVEKRLVEAENGKARFLQAQNQVDKVLNKFLDECPVPKFIRELIDKGWKPYLTIVALKYGTHSVRWYESKKTLRYLLISVRFPKTERQTKRLLKMSPVIGKRLRHGLELVSCRPSDTNHWLDQLEDLHLLLVKGDKIKCNHKYPAKLVKQDRAQVAPTKQTEINSQPKLSSSKTEQISANAEVSIPRTMKPVSLDTGAGTWSLAKSECLRQERAESEPDTLVPRSLEEKHKRILPANDPQVLQVESFATGAWFEFEINDCVQRCRFAALIPPTGQYIFVNRSGMKVAQNTKLELVELLKQKKLRPLDSSALFERALEHVVSQYRNKKVS